MEFFREEYWSGLPFLTPGDFPDPEIEPASLASLALAGRFFTTAPPGKPSKSYRGWKNLGGLALVMTKPWAASGKEDFHAGSARLWPTLPWTEFGYPEMWVILIKCPEGGFSISH